MSGVKNPEAYRGMFFRTTPKQRAIYALKHIDDNEVTAEEKDMAVSYLRLHRTLLKVLSGRDIRRILGYMLDGGGSNGKDIPTEI